MKYKILMLINPKAGKAKISKNVPKIKENLENLNYDVDVIFTTRDKNATYLIKEYKKDYEILIVCGGDGTLNETIQGLYEINKKVFIGYIPVGTTNDFGKSLKASIDIFNISKEINNYKEKKVDLGTFNKKIFIYSATFGIFSKCSYKPSFKWKNKIGRFAYFLFAIKEVFNYKTYNLKVKTEDNLIEDEFIFGSISNSQCVGGFKIYKKQDIKLDDGKFEVLLVKKPKNFIHLIKLTLKILNGNIADENIYYFRTSDIYLECENEMEWAIDGEFGGIDDKFNVSVINRYVDFIVPKEN